MSCLQGNTVLSVKYKRIWPLLFTLLVWCFLWCKTLKLIMLSTTGCCCNIFTELFLHRRTKIKIWTNKQEVKIFTLGMGDCSQKIVCFIFDLSVSNLQQVYSEINPIVIELLPLGCNHMQWALLLSTHCALSLSLQRIKQWSKELKNAFLSQFSFGKSVQDPII